MHVIFTGVHLQRWWLVCYMCAKSVAVTCMAVCTVLIRIMYFSVSRCLSLFAADKSNRFVCLFCVSLEVHEHLIVICLCRCAVVKKFNCGQLGLDWCTAPCALATLSLRLLPGLIELASQLPGPQLLSFSLCLLPGRLTQLEVQLPRLWQLLASAPWVDSACFLAGWASASFSLPLLSGLTQLAVLYRSGQHNLQKFRCVCPDSTRTLQY